MEKTEKKKMTRAEKRQANAAAKKQAKETSAEQKAAVNTRATEQARAHALGTISTMFPSWPNWQKDVENATDDKCPVKLAFLKSDRFADTWKDPEFLTLVEAMFGNETLVKAVGAVCH